MSENLQRIQIVFTYMGTNYHGWQRQKDIRDTVQEVFENTLTRFVSRKTTITASGRTDTGVHARVQVAHADVPKEFVERMLKANQIKNLNHTDRFVHGLNSILPKNIRVLTIKPMSDFHAQNQVKRKTYVYFIDPNPVQLPIHKNMSWHLRLPLDFNEMQKAASHFVGKHDFAAFSAFDRNTKSTVRSIYESFWEKVVFQDFSGIGREFWVYRVTGSGFLKQMVRSLVGTMVQIGTDSHRSPASKIRMLLNTSNQDARALRAQTGMTAPPHGLWLWDIEYSK